MKTAPELRELLNRIDQRSYSAYRDVKGSYRFGSYVLSIDHVQADPFAPPSRVSVAANGKQAGFPPELYQRRHRRIALQDHLTRLFSRQVERRPFRTKGTGKSGLIAVSRCGQEILERSACRIDGESGDVTMRFEIGFPARGRTALAKELANILFDFLPQWVAQSLLYPNLDSGAVSRVMELADDQHYIRRQLPGLGLAAFVADGAVLPRESGVSKRPMKGAVAFESPPSMAVTLDLPHRGPTRGMGIRRGVSLIVGGGYHGKSTLLKALEAGVYNHIAADGREYVITDDTAVKIRAEDGRSARCVDISLFINGLPGGRDTRSFSTADASGSTSQAVNIVEAMEAGARVFLIDEDTSATNFMIRDELMQQVVHRESEPITPFIDRVRELYERFGISSILVVGSSGSYFHKADCIVRMDHYLPREITALAREQAGRYPLLGEAPPAGNAPDFRRLPKAGGAIQNSPRVKVRSAGTDTVSLDRETIDLRLVEQLVDPEQLPALGYLLLYAQKHLFDGRQSLQTVVGRLWELVREEGIAAAAERSHPPCNLAMPRKQEIFACINRYRGLDL